MQRVRGATLHEPEGTRIWRVMHTCAVDSDYNQRFSMYLLATVEISEAKSMLRPFA
jgi:hypothetical protein